jgi:hypothetical protein
MAKQRVPVEQIARSVLIPRIQQRFIMQMLDAVTAQPSR